ncbi:MAG: glycosyltransferase family 4 protein [Nitrospinae bacterium]|nr:glycosyltransferase family 4 protein [Nitrospinota bacterium]
MTSNKRVCIDGRVITEQLHGIARYTNELISSLKNVDTNGLEFLVLLNHNCNTKNFVQEKNLNFKFVDIQPYTIIEQFKIPVILKKEKIDLYHLPSYGFPYFTPCKSIVTIHDMMHYFMLGKKKPLHYHYYNIFVRKAIKASSTVFTDSNFSKNEIVKFYGVDPGNIKVVYLQIDKDFIQLAQNEKKKSAFNHQEYLVSITNKFAHKNCWKLLVAFSELIQEGLLDINLVLFGKLNSMAESYLRSCTENVKERIRIYDKSSDREMISVIKGAKLFVFPSLYEGFGLPPNRRGSMKPSSHLSCA